MSICRKCQFCLSAIGFCRPFIPKIDILKIALLEHEMLALEQKTLALSGESLNQNETINIVDNLHDIYTSLDSSSKFLNIMSKKL